MSRIFLLVQSALDRDGAIPAAELHEDPSEELFDTISKSPQNGRQSDYRRDSFSLINNVTNAPRPSILNLYTTIYTHPSQTAARNPSITHPSTPPPIPSILCQSSIS
jgi:hypothetical protein